MSDEPPRTRRLTRPEQARPPAREEIWDRFIDELDRCGQAGSAADVLIPMAIQPDAPSGQRFGDLTRDDITALVSIGGNLGRRGDGVKMIWEQTQRQLKDLKRVKRQDAT